MGFIVAAAFSKMSAPLAASGILALIGIPAYSALILSVWYFALHRHGARWRSLGLTWAGARSIVVVVPVLFAYLVANAAVWSLISRVFGPISNPQVEALTAGGAPSNAEWGWLFMVFVGLGPFAEELYCRGMLFRYLRGRTRVPIAMVASAAVFAALHIYPMLLVSFFLIGIALAVVVEAFDSLYPAVALHALINAIALVAIYASVAH